MGSINDSLTFLVMCRKNLIVPIVIGKLYETTYSTCCRLLVLKAHQFIEKLRKGEFVLLNIDVMALCVHQGETNAAEIPPS